MILIDGSSYLYRAFHAYPGTMTINTRLIVLLCQMSCAVRLNLYTKLFALWVYRCWRLKV
ncbi:DNA polymerase I [Vibrio cholerae]|nr:DNA polymerase I [Vibrio cholerae]